MRPGLIRVAWPDTECRQACRPGACRTNENISLKACGWSAFLLADASPRVFNELQPYLPEGGSEVTDGLETDYVQGRVGRFETVVAFHLIDLWSGYQRVLEGLHWLQKNPEPRMDRWTILTENDNVAVYKSEEIFFLIATRRK